MYIFSKLFQTLETHGWTYISWNDPRLAWDKLDYDGLDRIRIHQKEIWVPDIIPFNLVEEPHYYTPTWDQGHRLIIYDNGNVIYAPQVNYKVNFREIDLFPFSQN